MSLGLRGIEQVLTAGGRPGSGSGLYWLLIKHHCSAVGSPSRAKEVGIIFKMTKHLTCIISFETGRNANLCAYVMGLL